MLLAVIPVEKKLQSYNTSMLKLLQTENRLSQNVC